MIKTEIVKGELPYRIEIDNLKGAGESPRDAAIVALSAGGVLPLEKRNAMDAAGYIFWNFEANPDWAYLIHILSEDTFERTEERDGNQRI